MNLLFKIEILVFLTSFFYIFYFLIEKLKIVYLGLKNVFYPDKSHLIEKIEKIKTNIELNNWNKIDNKNNWINKKLSNKQIKKLAEITKRVKVNKIKWYLDTAKSLIIEGLAIDKLNKELNLELASIYEEEKEFKKAEYIYYDLLEAYCDNFEILKKLAYNLAIQWEYEKSIEYFMKAFLKNKWDIEVIEYLADLYYELKNYKKSLKYIKLFLKQFPRNTEKLKMRAFSHEALWELTEALEIYNKVLELQPYNSQVSEKVKFLQTQI